MKTVKTFLLKMKTELTDMAYHKVHLLPDIIWMWFILKIFTSYKPGPQCDVIKWWNSFLFTYLFLFTKFKDIYFMCLSVLLMYVCVCTIVVPSAYGTQKRGWCHF